MNNKIETKETITCPHCKKTIELKDKDILIKLLKLVIKILDKKVNLPIWIIVLIIILISISSGLI